MYEPDDRILAAGRKHGGVVCWSLHLSHCIEVTMSLIIEKWRVRMKAIEKFYGIIEEVGEADTLCDMALRGLESVAPAQPAQKPIAQVTYSNWNGMTVCPLPDTSPSPVGTKLYTTPVPAQITEALVMEIVGDVLRETLGIYSPIIGEKILRAINAKLAEQKL